MMCLCACCILILLVVLCFFFFFKQKTAYEMRISDWSSDVCSSDLVVEHHPPIEHAARTAIPPTIPGVPVIRHPPSMRFDAAETAIAGSKIGRASCRERVCQYV